MWRKHRPARVTARFLQVACRPSSCWAESRPSRLPVLTRPLTETSLSGAACAMGGGAGGGAHALLQFCLYGFCNRGVNAETAPLVWVDAVSEGVP